MSRSSNPSKPSYIAFSVVTQGEGKDPYWCRIGAVWPHGDREGFDLVLNALPIDGRVVCRKPKDRGEDA